MARKRPLPREGALIGKTALVTGASSGLGKAVARRLAEAGAHVTLVCRDAERGVRAQREIQMQTGSGRVELLVADMEDPASIGAMARAYQARHPALHILVNNAGVFAPARRSTAAGLESTFAINHLGYFAVVDALLPALRLGAPARIINVASDAHYRGSLDWDDLQMEREPYKGWPAYCRSKLCNVIFTVELARRLEGAGITANALHPGMVATGIIRDLPWIVRQLWPLIALSPTKAAGFVYHLAESPALADVSGSYFEKLRRKPAADIALNAETGRRLWEVSEALLAAPYSSNKKE